MTGRRQLTLIHDDKMDALGIAAFASLKHEGELNQDPAIDDYVRCVVVAILEVVPAEYGPDDGRWEVLVFENATPNAFALPGGKIGVHTGMLDIATTPGQLAAVLGHEVSHVLLRHGNERMSQAILADAASEHRVQLRPARRRPSTRSSSSAGSASARSSACSCRSAGSTRAEADEVGQVFMAQAGFYPAEAITLWQSDGADAGGRGPGAVASRRTPPTKTRIANGFSANLPRAMAGLREARAPPGRTPSVHAAARRVGQPRSACRSAQAVRLHEPSDRLADLSRASPLE